MTTKPLDRIRRAMPLMPWLINRGASDAVKQAVQEAGWTTLGEAWDQCSDVDWLLWTLARISYPGDPTIRICACRFVRETPLLDHHVVGDLLTDPRSWAAIETAERFACGEASHEELTAAQEAAEEAVGAMVWAAAWAAQAAAWTAVEDATGAAQTAAWAAARAAAWTAQAVARAAAENTTEEEARATARAAMAAKVWDTAQAEATKFQADLLRQMIDPFHSDESK